MGEKRPFSTAEGGFYAVFDWSGHKGDKYNNDGLPGYSPGGVSSLNERQDAVGSSAGDVYGAISMLEAPNPENSATIEDMLWMRGGDLLLSGLALRWRCTELCLRVHDEQQTSLHGNVRRMATEGDCDAHSDMAMRYACDIPAERCQHFAYNGRIFPRRPCSTYEVPCRPVSSRGMVIAT
jgi:hypothetical protein